MTQCCYGGAAGHFGIGVEAAAPGTAVGLIEFGPRMRFHHPLALTAVAVQPSFSWESASMGKHEVILRQPAEGDRQCLI